MTSLKSTRRALFASLVSLILCFVMLCSTTFAWFTDVASSNGNIIQSGKLNVGMYWADGEDDLSSAGWNDASVGSIFDADGWEPGHIDSKHIRIVNEGNLAFKYDLVLATDGEVSALADVIDVYVVKDDTAFASTLDEPTSIGTLAELLSSSKSLVSGELSPNDPDTDDEISEKIITVTFKMREGLGKEYQNLNLGSGFSVKLLATQLGYDGDGSGDSSNEEEIIIPDYWKDYLDEKIIEINNKVEALGDDSDLFVFITDQHLDGGNEYSAEIINYIASKTSVNKVVFGGDNVRGGSADDVLLREYRDSFADDVLTLGMRGNHDDDGNLTADIFYDIMVKPLSGKAEISEELYYHYDSEEQKIRYIVTDSVASGTSDLTSDAQIAWMKSKILELDEDWTVVIFHHGLWEGSTTKQTLEFSVDGRLLINAVDSIYDSAKCTIAAICSGHNHRDYLGYSEKGYALISTTVNSADSALSKYDIMNPSRPEGTTKEETFDIMLVAPSSNKIEIIRIGAGDNRTIEYASNKPRDVEGVSLNRPFATTIIDGASIDLTATLTPAKVTDDRVIWSIESGAELGSISFDGLNCRFTPGQTAGTVVVQVKTVQGDYAASCTITIVEEPTSVNITSDFSWTPGSITYADGVASSNYSKDWVYSNLIDVSAYNSITFSHIQTTNSTTPLGYAFYDANGEYISGASNGGVSYDTVVKAVEIPDDAKFFRVMWMNTTHSRYTEEKYEITKHFFCYGNIGDSDPEITIPTQGVSLDKSSATVFTGEGSSVSLIASIIPDNATSNEVTWSIVSGTELGSISFDGLNCTFTPGQAAGTVVIQVKTVNGEYLADCIITILNKDSSLDITKDFIWTPGSITYADGVASSNYSKDWVYSNLIDVSAYNSITFSHIQTTNSTTPLGYAFYDANGEYISGASNSGVSYDTVVKTVEIPDGAKYFRVMWMNTTHSRYTEEKYEINEHFFCYGNSNSSDTEDDGPIVLISNEEFVYGAYFDLDSTGAMKTSGAYGNIKTSHTLLPSQNITVKVEDSDLSLYYVTIGYFDADGKYKGKSGLLKMTDGEITISASSMTSSHFRVNVYKYNGGFPKVPETATINVYGEKPVVKNWEGKTISIVGDSISAGSYPSMLGTISGAIIDNNAVSGSLLVNKGKTMVSQLSEISDDADLIIVFGGTNDYWHKSVQIGELSSTDSTTFLGALDYYLSYLETNHPNAEYLFVFPADQTFGGDSSDTDFGYGTLGDFRDAFIEFCTARGVNHLDLGTSEYDCSVHSGDGVHPNTAGHQVIAEAIYEYIADISPKAK